MARIELTEELSKYVLPPLQWDGLSLTAVDAPALAAFWGAALGGRVRELGDGGFRIDPGPQRPGREIVRIAPVRSLSPDPARVHVDVRLPGRTPDALLAAGARIVRSPGAEPWYVMADPEGNEFCAYPAVDRRPAGIFELVVKSRDAYAQARWWAAVLGGEVAIEGEAAAVRSAPEFPWDYLLFDPVPDPRSGLNRMHWHVTLRDSDPGDLVARGARMLRRPAADGEGWVLADPEGNEFCAHPA